MTVENVMSSPAEDTAALSEMYDGFRQEHLVALWTEIGDLMPASPRSRAVPHLWRWREGLFRAREDTDFSRADWLYGV